MNPTSRQRFIGSALFAAAAWMAVIILVSAQAQINTPGGAPVTVTGGGFGAVTQNVVFSPDNTWSFGAASAAPTTMRANNTYIVGAGGSFLFVGRSQMFSAADGEINFANNAGSLAMRARFAATPTVASGFGTGPSVTANSAPSMGSVNVGTGGAATSGIVNFNTTWAAAPFCVAGSQGQPTGATTSTTQLTLTVTAAWAASTVVTWVCFGT